MNALLSPSPSVTLLSGVATLSHLGVIQISGEDAAKFIHGQLTQDFSLLGQDQARLAAFCSAKGRMQASFVGFKRPNGDILLVCSRDLLPATLKRLSMFVLRAKAKLTDASAEFALYGLSGDATKTVAGSAHSAWAKVDFDDQSVVILYPADGVARQLLVAPVGSPSPEGASLPLEIWQWGEVRSAVAMLTLPVAEAFVPQMLNYESVGGVNFKKGCYPGQEVVARSQFRGTLKRRAFLFHCEAPMASGDEVFSAGDASQPAGVVVQAAPAPSGGFDALISVQLSALDTGSLHLQSADGPGLLQLPLPYSLLDDI
jgi:hypothetical protein